MCDPELGALEDIRGDISVPLTRMLGHWWAISGPEMLLSVTLVHCKPEVYLGGPIPLCTLEVIAVLA